MATEAEDNEELQDVSSIELYPNLNNGSARGVPTSSSGLCFPENATIGDRESYGGQSLPRGIIAAAAQSSE